MNQQPAPLPHPYQTPAPPPPDCGANPALREPLPWPPGGFDASYFTCITPPYGTRAAPNFAECCDSQVANFTEVHLTSEGPSSCAAYCSVKPDRLLVVDYRASDFLTCLFGGEEADRAVELECWDAEGFVGDFDWEERFPKDDGNAQHKKREALPQESTDAPEPTTTTTTAAATYDSSLWSSLLSAAATDTAAVSLPVEGVTTVTDASTTYESTTTYDSSFWSSLISAAATDTASITLPTVPATPVPSGNGTASSVTGSFVSVSEISGTKTDASASSTAASSTAAVTSAAGSGSSSDSASSSAPTSAASDIGYGKWMCTGLVLSAVFAALS